MSDKPVQQPQGAMSPAKAISRWADTVNWILLNASSLHIPNHLHATLQEECQRIRAAVAHEQPPASPSVAPEQQRMKGNPACGSDDAHSREHDKTRACVDIKPYCEPVDPSAPPSSSSTASAEELYNALRESLKLQRHYAELLNMNDGGQRRLDVFASPEAWIARLRETGDLPSAPDQARDDKRSTT